MQATPVQLDIYRTSIPMRRFEHAAAARELAEAIVVRLELSGLSAGRARTAGAVGWGETLPRQYVTGETLQSVPRDIEQILWPACLKANPQGRDLPTADGERPITAARCAVELALLDAAGRQGTSPGLRLKPFPAVRVSGVLGSADPGRTARHLRWMRWYGLRDFKLKLGFGDDADAENLRLVQKRIGRGVARGKCTLRVDVNGGWQADETHGRVQELKPLGVCVVEQPVFGPPEALMELAQRCDLPLMADESLIRFADAKKLLDAPGRKVWLNIRLSKNGGMWPCQRIAEAAGKANVPFAIGCMVGESSILSAAQRRLLQSCPPPRFAEGNYGRFLLADDLTTKSLRLGYGGRLRQLAGSGMGVRVDPRRMARYGRLVKTLRA